MSLDPSRFYYGIIGDGEEALIAAYGSAVAIGMEEPKAWSCDLCTFHNTETMGRFCSMCGNPRKGELAHHQQTTTSQFANSNHRNDGTITRTNPMEWQHGRIDHPGDDPEMVEEEQHRQGGGGTYYPKDDRQRYEDDRTYSDPRFYNGTYHHSPQHPRIEPTNNSYGRQYHHHPRYDSTGNDVPETSRNDRPPPRQQDFVQKPPTFSPSRYKDHNSNTYPYKNPDDPYRNLSQQVLDVVPPPPNSYRDYSIHHNQHASSHDNHRDVPPPPRRQDDEFALQFTPDIRETTSRRKSQSQQGMEPSFRDMTPTSTTTTYTDSSCSTNPDSYQGNLYMGGDKNSLMNNNNNNNININDHTKFSREDDSFALPLSPEPYATRPTVGGTILSRNISQGGNNGLEASIGLLSLTIDDSNHQYHHHHHCPPLSSSTHGAGAAGGGGGGAGGLARMAERRTSRLPELNERDFQMSFANWSISDQGAWACIACTYVNTNPLHLTCEVCGQTRPRKSVSEYSQRALQDMFETSIRTGQHDFLRRQQEKIEEIEEKVIAIERIHEIKEIQAELLNEIATSERQRPLSQSEHQRRHEEEQRRDYELAQTYLKQIEEMRKQEREEQQRMEDHLEKRRVSLGLERLDGDDDNNNNDDYGGGRRRVAQHPYASVEQEENAAVLEVRAQERMLSKWREQWKHQDDDIETIRRNQQEIMNKLQRKG